MAFYWHSRQASVPKSSFHTKPCFASMEVCSVWADRFATLLTMLHGL